MVRRFVAINMVVTVIAVFCVGFREFLFFRAFISPEEHFKSFSNHGLQNGTICKKLNSADLHLYDVLELDSTVVAARRCTLNSRSKWFTVRNHMIHSPFDVMSSFSDLRFLIDLEIFSRKKITQRSFKVRFNETRIILISDYSSVTGDAFRIAHYHELTFLLFFSTSLEWFQ